jgi:hypothetical protein
MNETERRLAELDWFGLVRMAIERLAGARPFVFNKDLGPSCTLRRAVMTVLCLKGEEADEVLTLLGYDPGRRVRKPQ